MRSAPAANKRVALCCLALGAALTLGGCYYRLTDPFTGTVYYTSDHDAKWSLGPGESVLITDPSTGAKTLIQRPKIETISRKEFEAATGQKTTIYNP